MTGATPTPPPEPGLVRFLALLTPFLALGNLVWFVGTFPSYFRWFSQGWMSPGIPLFLLWAFLGLPSLACATVSARLARQAGRPGRLGQAAFLLILAVCTLVPLLGSFAGWTSGRPGFPWAIWLVTLTLSLGLSAFVLRTKARS